jgi:hypothetical protein
VGHAPPGGAVGPLRGSSCLYEEHIFFKEIYAQDKLYILVATLLSWNILRIT